MSRFPCHLPRAAACVLLLVALAACGPTTKEIARESNRRAQALESSGDLDAAIESYAAAVRTAGRADARAAYARLAAARLDRRIAEASAMGDRQQFAEGIGHLGTLDTWMRESAALGVALGEPASVPVLRLRLRTGAAEQALASARDAFARGDDDAAIGSATNGRRYDIGGTTDEGLVDVEVRARNRAATRVGDEAAATLRAGRPFDALTALARAYAYQPNDGAVVAALNQTRTGANQRAAEIRLAEADAAPPDRAFDIATDGLRYPASRAIADRLRAAYDRAAIAAVTERIAAANTSADAGRADESRQALTDATRFAVTDALRATLGTARADIGARVIDSAFSDARQSAERGDFQAAYRLLDSARPFREGALTGRFDQARGDLVLVHADALDTGGRPGDALDLLRGATLPTDAQRRRAGTMMQGMRLHATDLAFERADAWAREGRIGAADTALAVAAAYGVPGLAARLDSARARLLLDRAQDALTAGRFRAALDLTTRLDTARRALPRGIRARQSSLRGQIVERGQMRVLIVPSRGGEGVDAATLSALNLRIRAAYGDAHPLVAFVPIAESDRALARLANPDALADGDALALARTLRAGALVIVDVAAADSVGGAANTDATAADGPAVRRIETTYRILRVNDRRELARETVAARGQAGLAPDPRNDAIAAALLTRLLARLESLVP